MPANTNDSGTTKAPPTGRSATGRFLPGTTGNISGRPPGDPEMRQLARARTAESIARLVHWLRSDDAVASVAAARELLNRGHGRPEQSINLPNGVNVNFLGGPVTTVTNAEEAAQIYQRIMRGSIDPGEVAWETVPPIAPIAPPPPPRPPRTLSAPSSHEPLRLVPPPSTAAPPPTRDDLSVVLVVEEPLRHFHEHRPSADSVCPKCRHLWVVT